MGSGAPRELAREPGERGVEWLPPGFDRVLRRLCGFVEARDFRGYDPYDALRSPLLRFGSLGLKWPRIAATQVLRRLPVNLRPLLGVAKGRNPKGLGLFLSSYSRLLGLEDPAGTRGICDRLFDLLRGAASPGYSGCCWGYDFPWQSRAFYLPAGTPTVVNTCFIGQALLDYHAVSGSQQALRMARSACDFVLNDLNRHRLGDGQCFSYTPLDNTRIHNANALAAGLLSRVFSLTREESLAEEARSAARYILAHQHDDGSWAYAETDYQGWIDSFHTGFVLDSLLLVAEHAAFEPAWQAHERGLAYFTERFFEQDGEVRYYHDSLRPLDIHCPTQALVSLVRSWPVARRPDLLERVLQALTTRWLDPAGYFYFRLGRWGRPNRIPYMRWGQAWALHALTSVHELAASVSRETG